MSISHWYFQNAITFLLIRTFQIKIFLSHHLIFVVLIIIKFLIRLMWHFDLRKFRQAELGRVKISLACVFAFMAIGWPLIVYKAGLVGWFKFWFMPWMGYHFWVYAVSLFKSLFSFGEIFTTVHAFRWILIFNWNLFIFFLGNLGASIVFSFFINHMN